MSRRWNQQAVCECIIAEVTAGNAALNSITMVTGPTLRSYLATQTHTGIEQLLERSFLSQFCRGSVSWGQWSVGVLPSQVREIHEH